ncbi:MAG: PEP-CTERM sorting domain-containing protein, partial [Aeoliella sp.]
TVIEPASADWNHDGVVDAVDYAIWRAGFGTTDAAHTDGDGNNDGLVDAADYAIWRDSLGNGATATALGTAVPEPTSGMLLLASWAAILRRKR